MPEELIDTSKVEKQEDRANRKQERILSDIRFILVSKEGRRFIWKFLSDAGVFRRSYNGDSNGTLFNEGRRSIGLDLLNLLLEAKPESFSQMQQEYQSEIASMEAKDKEELKKEQGV